MRIGIIGPESTGKSTLGQQLASFFHATYVPEYARTYVEALDRPYTYEDVVAISQHQIEEIQTANQDMVFFDTELIITKIWFVYQYGACPQWLEESIRDYPMDYYLICYPDLVWQADPCRENGDIREELYLCYLNEVKKLNIPYSIIRGSDDTRLQCAIDAILPRVR